MVDAAKQRLPNATIKQGLIQDFDQLYPGKKFDLIASTGALEFVPDLDQLIPKAGAALNPGGILAFSYERREVGQPQWLEMSAKTATMSGTVKIHKRSPEEVEAALAAPGLEVIDHEQYIGYNDGKRDVPYGLVVARKAAS